MRLPQSTNSSSQRENEQSYPQNCCEQPQAFREDPVIGFHKLGYHHGVDEMATNKDDPRTIERVIGK